MNGADFQPAEYGTTAATLLEPRRLAELGPGAPNDAVRGQLQALTAEALFAGRRIVDHDMASACLAGLWLYHDFLDASHRLSQEIETPTGSFWHGVMHRREGDFGNAKYWFRRVGEHPVYPRLHASAAQLCQDGLADARGGALASGPRWDPLKFVDLCQQATRGDTALNRLCRQVQLREWELLFDYCYRAAALDSGGMGRLP